MKSKPVELRVEAVILGMLVLAGVLLRIFALDYLPLSDGEARLALPVLESRATNDAAGILPMSALYSFLLWVLAMMMPVTDSMVRIIAAGFGSLMLLVPVMLRKELGAVKTIVFTALLALSPLLVTISRTAESVMLSASTALLFAASMVRFESEYRDTGKGRARWGTAAGIFAGLFIASGPDSIFVFTIAVAVLYVYSIFSPQGFLQESLRMMRGWLRDFGWITALCAVLVSAGLGFKPSGVMELFNAVQGWLNGWLGQPQFGVGSAFASVVLYEPFWLLAAAGMIMGIVRRNESDKLGLIWLAVSTLLYVVYPGRTAGGIIWILLAGVYFACTVMTRLISWLADEPREPLTLEVLGAALVILVLLVFAYLQVGGYAQQAYSADLEQVLPRLGIAIGAAATGVVVLFFFGMGWGWKFSASAGILSSGSLMVAVVISSIWHLNFMPTAVSASEAWRVKSLRFEVNELVDTLERISVTAHGERSELSVRYYGDDSPALEWYLRPFRVHSGTGSGSPEAIVVRAEEIPSTLPDAYTGRVDTLYETKGWLGAFPPNLSRWWFKRQAPVYLDEWALLVRTDLMLVQLETDAEFGMDENDHDE